MAGVILPNGKNYFARVDGTPGNGYRLYTYIAGTSTSKVTYSDHAGTVPNSNPVIADTRGEMLVYWSGTYDVVLKDENDVLIWGPERLEDGAGNLQDDLADSSSTSLGDAMIAVKRTDLANSIATTQHLLNKALPVYLGPLYGLTLGAGATGGQRTANTTAINAALAAAKVIGSKVIVPAGILEFNGTLYGQNGVNVEGHGNMGEEAASNFLGSMLVYYGTGDAIDLRGTDVSVSTRVQCCLSDFTLKDGQAANGSRGILLGWNQRSIPLLRNITVVGFGDSGIYDDLTNWLYSTENVRIDACGTRTAGSTGWGKSYGALLDSGGWLDIHHHNLTIESCGTATSVAGGMYLPTATANRSIGFSGATTFEGNLGVREFYVSNMSDVTIEKLYIERTLLSTQIYGAMFENCTGSVGSGYVTCETLSFLNVTTTNTSAVITGIADTSRIVTGMYVSGLNIPTSPIPTVLSIQAGVGITMTGGVASGTSSVGTLRLWLPNTIGIRLLNCPKFSVENVDLGRETWGQASLSNYGSLVSTKNNSAGSTSLLIYEEDSTGQWIGDHAARFSANLGGSNQTGVVTATFTQVKCNTKVWDETTAYNISTWRWIPKRVGQYHFDCAVTFTVAVDATRMIVSLYRNGAALKSAVFQASGTGAHTLQLSVDVDVGATTDYFELWARQDSGSDKIISGAADETYFTGHLIQ